MRKRTKFFGTTVGGLSLLHTDWINQDFPPAWKIPADIGKGPARVGAFALSEALIENASPLAQRDALAWLGLNGVGLGNAGQEMQGPA